LAATAGCNPLCGRQLTLAVEPPTAARKLDEKVANSAVLGDDGILPEHLWAGLIVNRIASESLIARRQTRGSVINVI
jgi:hypothetical protein